MKIHTRLTWVSRLKNVIQQLYWLITFLGYNWGQSYSATLVTPPNCKKMLRNLTFAVQFAYFSIRSKKVFVTFRGTFVTKSNFWAPFLRNYKKIFGKSRATCGEPYTRPYITDSFVCPAKMIHIFSVKLTRTPVNTDNGHLFVSRDTNCHKSSWLSAQCPWLDQRICYPRKPDKNSEWPFKGVPLPPRAFSHARCHLRVWLFSLEGLRKKIEKDCIIAFQEKYT